MPCFRIYLNKYPLQEPTSFSLSVLGTLVFHFYLFSTSAQALCFVGMLVAFRVVWNWDDVILHVAGILQVTIWEERWQD